MYTTRQAMKGRYYLQRRRRSTRPLCMGPPSTSCLLTRTCTVQLTNHFTCCSLSSIYSPLSDHHPKKSQEPNTITARSTHQSITQRCRNNTKSSSSNLNTSRPLPPPPYTPSTLPLLLPPTKDTLPPAYTPSEPLPEISGSKKGALPGLPRLQDFLGKVQWDKDKDKMAAPRMLLLDGGPSGGEAFVTLPTTYDVSRLCSSNLFTLPSAM